MDHRPEGKNWNSEASLKKKKKGKKSLNLEIERFLRENTENTNH